MKQIAFFIILVLGAHIVSAQNQSEILDRFRFYNLDIKNLELESYDDFESKMILWRFEFLWEFDFNTSVHESIREYTPSDAKTPLGAFLYHLNYGDYLFYKHEDLNAEAKEEYSKALNIGLDTNNAPLICEAIKGLLNLNRQAYLMDNSTAAPYLELYEKHKYDEFEAINFNYYTLILSFQYFKLDQWDTAVAENLLMYAKNSPYYFINGKIFYLLATHAAAQKDLDKGIYYKNLAIQEFKKIPYNYASTQTKNAYIGLTRYYVLDEDFSNARKTLAKIDTNHRNKLEKDNYRYTYFYQSLIDSVATDYFDAFNNLMSYTAETELVLHTQNKKLFDELEAKYQTEKKEKENIALQLSIEKEQRQKRYLLLGTAALLFFGALIAVLLQKNTTKKRRLAEQERLLEQQKVEVLLREQELVSIDAMIAGQEKERQRVANELHDDLGSLMATVKLHFDNVKVDKKDLALKKAQNLLEEAYQKIRGMAHSKNSGVMANEGLVPAVQKMACTLSDTRAIKVNVEDYGMDERLENSLELTIFRIIQELITNIIKHAEATRANIQFTRHEDNLNIIVEDNGMGFDWGKGPLSTKGMGLTSIEKRLEHLEGNFTVDSVPGKGTSILIDIPV